MQLYQDIGLRKYMTALYKYISGKTGRKKEPPFEWKVVLAQSKTYKPVFNKTKLEVIKMFLILVEALDQSYNWGRGLQFF